MKLQLGSMDKQNIEILTNQSLIATDDLSIIGKFIMIIDFVAEKGMAHLKFLCN